MSTQVFVANLNFETTEDQVAKHFSQVGSVRDVKIPKDRETGRSRGFAFVRFESEEEVEEAIATLDGSSLAGRPLKVRIAEERSQERRPRRVPGQERLSDEPDESWSASNRDDDFGERGDSRRPRKKNKRDWRRMRQTKRSL
jgi:RNA recognition motif-containing protein